MNRPTEILVYGLLCTISVFLAAGVGGVYFLSNEAMDEERDAKVKIFNTAVEKWKEVGEEHWRGVGSMELTGLLGTSVHMNGEVIPSGIIDDHPDLEQFEEYAYKGVYQKRMNGWVDSTADIYLRLENSSAMLLVGADLPIAKTMMIRTSLWKNCHHGSLDEAKAECLMRKTLSSVSIGLVHDGNYENWRIVGEPEMKYISVITPRFEKSDTAAHLTPIIKTAFTARAALDDPYLVARNITGGSTEFGLDHSERIFLGFFLLCISIGALLLSFFTVYSSRNAKKQMSPAYTRAASFRSETARTIPATHSETDIDIMVEEEASPRPSRPGSVSPSEIEMEARKDRTDV